MSLIGAAGFCGSFWSYSLTLVVYAKAVAQIEAVMAVGLALTLWREREVWPQLPGIALVLSGIGMLWGRFSILRKNNYQTENRRQTGRSKERRWKYPVYMTFVHELYLGASGESLYNCRRDPSRGAFEEGMEGDG